MKYQTPNQHTEKNKFYSFIIYEQMCVHAFVYVRVPAYSCVHTHVWSRDCPVTGNSVPLLLSDKQQHIVRQLSGEEEEESGGERGEGSVLLTPG